MLSFATDLPVPGDVTSAKFLAAVSAWLLGSPHTVFRAADFEGIATQAEFKARKSNESVECLSAPATDTSGMAAVRYTRMDKGLEWVTTVAYAGGIPSGWVGIRVSCESQHPSVRLPAARKPVVVRTLLASLGSGRDGELVVQSIPIRLSNSDVPLAARCLTGEAGTRLPIVYVSAGFRAGHSADADLMADKLSGMAHVLLEPNRPFSLRLMQEVRGENVYGGAVGIYWPDGAGRRAFFIGKQFESPSELQEAVLDEIRLALVNRRPLARVTWAAVQERTSQQRLEDLKKSGTAAINDYIANFDREASAARQDLADAEREIGRLNSELKRYQARVASQAGISLQGIPEQDLYEGEILGVIRDALHDAQSRVQPDGRRQHILDALVSANPPTGQADAYKSQLKDLLRDYRSMDSKTRDALEELGFEISEDGKHFKLTYQGDDRYVFTLAKTGSDHRGGLNAASDIGKRIF